MLCYKEEVLNNAPHTWVWSDAARYVEMAECEYVSLCIPTVKMKDCAEGRPFDDEATSEDYEAALSELGVTV